MRKAVLKEIHSGHQGIVKTKALACNFVRWPNLDSDVEQMCKECETCQMEQWRPQHVPLNPWEIEKTSFRLCRTFSDVFLCACSWFSWMLIRSGWKCFGCHNSLVTSVTKLRRLFASYGLPEQIVTDNATTFTSEEFQTFVKQNGILHTTSAPGHPATNGLAERYVQTFKTGMKKLDNTTVNIDDRLSLFLLQYRTTPNCTTGQSPADQFLNRHVRTRLDFLKPCTKEIYV